ncbi:MAG: outer membrane protein transport protein, partial [Gammaproteobacteria bacterium]|nr:outer membrane protein transport protein [Gammaproteobacteria bacterium]
MATTHPFARRLNATCIAGLLSMTSAGAFASGFALIEQSVSSMGTAYAGAGSASEDASYVFFNPASMSELEGTQMSAGVHVVLPSSEFKGACTYNPANLLVLAAGPPAPGDPCAPGNDGGDGGVTGVVPHFTYVSPVNEKWDFGFGVNAPFGLST